MKNNIRIYRVKSKYIKYLSMYQEHIFAQDAEKDNRKYIGVVFEIKGMKYFAPLSSFKDKHKKMKESIDFIKIKDYAVINLNNMIYVKAKLIADDGEEKEILSFGPFTIYPVYQRKGYGRRLLEHSFEVAREMGYDTVAIWGNPENYACYGFKNCKRFHVCLEENVFPVALMVKELEEGILADKSWKFMESPAHQMDESGFEEFDKSPPHTRDFSRKLGGFSCKNVKHMV